MRKRQNGLQRLGTLYKRRARRAARETVYTLLTLGESSHPPKKSKLTK